MIHEIRGLTNPAGISGQKKMRDIRQIGAALMVNHSHLAIEAAIDSQGVALVSDISAEPMRSCQGSWCHSLIAGWHLATDIISYLVQADHVEMEMSFQDGWRTS